MLRVAGTGMLALSRNELFAATQTIAADPDDPEAEVPGEERAWVPSVGLGEQLFTVPTYFLMQVTYQTPHWPHISSHAPGQIYFVNRYLAGSVTTRLFYERKIESCLDHFLLLLHE